MTTAARPKVGDRVHVLTCEEHPFGVVVEDVPEKDGCMVRPDGCKQSYGWGYSELLLIPTPGPTALERLMKDTDDFG